jgi:hypothetical protein
MGVAAVQSSPGPDLCVSRDRASAWLTFPEMHFSAGTVQGTLVISVSHDRERVHCPLSNLLATKSYNCSNTYQWYKTLQVHKETLK